jgi:AbrB family looped-hinge helix DNA binding protein
MVYGIVNGMTLLKIDHAGRIVVPKRLRDRLNLYPGSQLEVEEAPNGIFLRPTRRRASLIEKDGILLHLGVPPTSFDWHRIVDVEREDRLRDIAGL